MKKSTKKKIVKTASWIYQFIFFFVVIKIFIIMLMGTVVTFALIPHLFPEKIHLIENIVKLMIYFKWLIIIFTYCLAIWITYQIVRINIIRPCWRKK